VSEGSSFVNQGKRLRKVGGEETSRKGMSELHFSVRTCAKLGKGDSRGGRRRGEGVWTEREGKGA